MAAKVTIVNNGPIRIEGEFTIQDAEGNSFGLAGRTVISLCRCGLAENKPFCDGSHGRNGFSSQCKARDLPPPKPKPVLEPLVQADTDLERSKNPTGVLHP